MNRLLQIILLVLALGVVSIPADAQKKRKAKTTKTTRTTRTKSSGNKQSQPVKTPTKVVPKKRSFEGALRYIEYSYASKAAQKHSHSQVNSGTSFVIKIIKGNKIHIYNEKFFLHTIFDLDNNKYIVYSDLTEEGYILNLSDFEKSPYGLQYKMETIGWGKGSKTSYNGQEYMNCTRNFTSQGTTYSGEMWWSEIYAPAPILTYLYGKNINGIQRRSLSEIYANMNVGVIRTVQAAELLEFYEYKVPEKEFIMPTYIKRLTTNKYPSAPLLQMGLIINNFNKNQEKAAKKLHLIETGNQEEALAQIQNEWHSVANASAIEKQSKSIFRTVVDEYGVDRLGNDIALAMNQAASVFENDIPSVTAPSQSTDMPTSHQGSTTLSSSKPENRITLDKFVESESSDRAYNNYRDQLIGLKYGGHPACLAQDRVTVQKKMKEIRKNMEKNGIRKITKSEWEDWDGK